MTRSVPRVATIVAVGLALAGGAPPIGAARAATWNEVLAAETDTVFFVTNAGALLRAPFHLGAAETLWVPEAGEKLTRLLVSPAGRSVAWLSRAGDRLPTTLWRAGDRPTQAVAKFQALVPSDLGTLHFESTGPTTDDLTIRGERLCAATAMNRGPSCNVLEWAPDGRDLVFGDAEGLLRMAVDSMSADEVSRAIVRRVKLLDPAPIYLAEVIRAEEGPRPHGTDPAEVTGPISTPGSAFLGGRAEVPTGRQMAQGRYLVYPAGRRWPAFDAADFQLADPWAASFDQVWWASGKKIWSVRSNDPKPTLEADASGAVPWLEFDVSRRSLMSASGRQVLRRREGERGDSVVLSLAAPIRAVLRPPRGSWRGFVSGDSLILWNTADDARASFMLPGLEPSGLFEGTNGEIVVTGLSGKPALPALFRADRESRRLIQEPGSKVKGGVFVSSPGGSAILFFRPDDRPPGKLRVYEIATARWAEIPNPGVLAWEPVAP